MTDRKTDAALRSFFTSEMLPLAARLKSGGHRFLETSLDPRAGSYYVPRTKRRMDRADFEALADLTPETLSRELTAFWRATGRDALLPLVPTLCKLASALRNTERPTDDVSPFVYMMY